MKNFFLKLLLIFVGDLFATRFAKKGMDQVTTTSQHIVQIIKFGLIQVAARCVSVLFFLVGLGFFFHYADYHLRNTLGFSDPDVSAIYFVTFSVIAVFVALLPRWIRPSQPAATASRKTHLFGKSDSLPVATT